MRPDFVPSLSRTLKRMPFMDVEISLDAPLQVPEAHATKRVD